MTKIITDNQLKTLEFNPTWIPKQVLEEIIEAFNQRKQTFWHREDLTTRPEKSKYGLVLCTGCGEVYWGSEQNPPCRINNNPFPYHRGCARSKCNFPSQGL